MPEKIKVIRGGKLIDGTGKAPIENSVLIIKDKTIEAVGPSEKVDFPRDAEVIDVSGKTVMPGLIDAHVHFTGYLTLNTREWIHDHPYLRVARAAMDAWRLIDSGFTSCRDMSHHHALYLRQAIDEGSLIGPRIVSCGRGITITGGHLDEAHWLPIEWLTQYDIRGRVADGVAECRKAVREQLRDGADFIKICTSGGVMSERDKPTDTQHTLEEISAICEEAAAVGKKVASHAIGSNGIKNALLGGVKTIEHGAFLNEECINLMLEKEAYYIPTLSVVEALSTKGEKAGLPEHNRNKARKVYEAHSKSFINAWKAGVKIGLGCDYILSPMIYNGVMGHHSHELELYVENGLTPMEAIVCATKNNAEALDLAKSVGTLEPGKLADFLIVNGDPLVDITVLADKRNIEYVFKDGIRLPRLVEY
jgi:imidazolonepropionase-like amidohydrolase